MNCHRVCYADSQYVNYHCVCMLTVTVFIMSFVTLLVSMSTVNAYVTSTIIVFSDVSLYVMLTFCYMNCNWMMSTVTMLSVSSHCVMCMWTVTVFVVLTVSLSTLTVCIVDYHCRLSSCLLCWLSTVTVYVILTVIVFVVSSVTVLDMLAVTVPTATVFVMSTVYMHVMLTVIFFSNVNLYAMLTFIMQS